MSFKLYTAYEGFRLADGDFMHALEAVKAVGGLPIIHAENGDVIDALVARHLAEGHTTPKYHALSRPAIMEAEAAARVVDLAALVGTPVYVAHVSCADAAARITSARRRGLPVFAETCPQYLFLDDSLYERPGVEGALPVCAPPLRSPIDQAALWDALGRGDLQVFSTDHCPFTCAEKSRGLEKGFSSIPGGVPSIEARFSLLYHFGVRTGRISANRWVELCCAAPARLFGLHRKGHVAPGFDADVVIFDPDRTVTLSPETLHEEVDWTPYDGFEVTGWPRTVISRGEVIVESGEFIGSAGRGQFVARIPYNQEVLL
jgi:dihydropyrimidinase